MFTPDHHGEWRRYGPRVLSIAATLGWMAVTMVFVGSSDPPDLGPPVWWTPILGHLFLFVVFGILVSVDFVLVAGSNRFAPNIAVVLLAGII
jgi:hypothetical protein